MNSVYVCVHKDFLLKLLPLRTSPPPHSFTMPVSDEQWMETLRLISQLMQHLTLSNLELRRFGLNTTAPNFNYAQMNQLLYEADEMIRVADDESSHDNASDSTPPQTPEIGTRQIPATPWAPQRNPPQAGPLDANADIPVPVPLLPTQEVNPWYEFLPPTPPQAKSGKNKMRTLGFQRMDFHNIVCFLGVASMNHSSCCILGNFALLHCVDWMHAHCNYVPVAFVADLLNKTSFLDVRICIYIYVCLSPLEENARRAASRPCLKPFGKRSQQDLESKYNDEIKSFYIFINHLVSYHVVSYCIMSYHKFHIICICNTANELIHLECD